MAEHKIAYKLAGAGPTPLYSLEFFPPKTAQGRENLFPRIARLVNPDQARALRPRAVPRPAAGAAETDADADADKTPHTQPPAWVDVTWGAGGSTDKDSLEIARRIQAGDLAVPPAPAAGGFASAVPQVSARAAPTDVLLHLTCTNVTLASLRDTLQAARDAGIRNLLALRGDPPRGQEYWVAVDERFQHAVDLVQFIRAEHGDWFCIGVAAYPEGHPDDDLDDAHKVERDIEYLRVKQAAGAEFVVTQLFYDAAVFLDWERRVRAAGVTLPIVPALMPIVSYKAFRRVSTLCKIAVPAHVSAAVEERRHDDVRVREYGTQLALEIMHAVHASPTADVRAFHLCTLNLERSTEWIVAQSPWWTTMPSPSSASTASAAAAATPAAAVATTWAASSAPPALLAPGEWDEFPNGRLGDIRSPAYGEIDGYGANLKLPAREARATWGAPQSDADISRIFTSYLEGSLGIIPWWDGPLMEETQTIRDALLLLNAPRSSDSKSESGSGSGSGSGSSGSRSQGRGWWTVGSQPAVDGVASADRVFGFGPAGGYVYQKAYVELFLSDEDKERIVRAVEASAALGQEVSYFAWRPGTGAGPAAGEQAVETNVADGVSVTWAVWPGTEVVQATMIERGSFRAWAEEAFAIWTQWAALFPPHSPAHAYLAHAAGRRWLLTLVHEDYKRPHALWDWLAHV